MMDLSAAGISGRVASETRREGSEQRTRSSATPSSGTTEQRSIATQIAPLPPRGFACDADARGVHNEAQFRSLPGELPMALDPTAIPALAAEYASRDPREILAIAIREYAPDLR